MQLLTMEVTLYLARPDVCDAPEHIGEFAAAMKMNHPAQLNCRRPAPEGGFTLIELMLAMGVCAIVLAAINGVFFGALRLREATIRAVDEAEPAQLALTTMRNDLQSAMSPTTNGVMAGDFRVGTSPASA